jgi:hypothetical protein
MSQNQVDRGSATADLRLLISTPCAQSPRQVTLQLILLLVGGVVGGASLMLLIPIVASMKNEMYHRYRFPTRQRAWFAVAQYIELFYNRKRHSQGVLHV